MEKFDLLFIGCGNMGEAILKSIKDLETKIGVVETNEERIKQLKVKYPEVSFLSHIDDSIKTKYLILAVKPQHYNQVNEMYQDKISTDYVISIMAGIEIETLEKDFPSIAVCRVMPNTPALFGESASAYILNDIAENDEEFKQFIKEFLSKFGKAVKIKDERLMDVITGLSGSGPAYFISIVEAFIEVGIKEGLTYNQAKDLILQTMKGTAIMLEKSNEATSTLKYKVMSPGGTTASGIYALESNGIRKAIYEAVISATERVRSLRNK